MSDLVVKRGVPSKYTSDMCDTIIKIAASGGHIAEMRVAIDCRSKETWYRWKKEYPEFAEAVEYAELVSQAYWERLGHDGLQSKSFNATTYALIMNNKFGDDYKRSGTGANSSTEITINTVTLSSEQIQQRITQKLDKLKSLGVTLEHVPSKLIEEHD